MKEFKKDLRGWADDHNDAVAADRNRSPSPDQRGEAELERTARDTQQEEDWRTRLEATDIILNNIEDAYKDYQSGNSMFMYTVDNKMAGILLADTSKAPPEVSWLVTHPGSTGVGGALIKQAVNMSQSSGSDDKLMLLPLIEGLRNVYQELGFVENEDSHKMLLEPANSDKWQKVEGKWKLAKYSDKKYVG